MTFRALLHRALRDEDRVRPDRAVEPRAHVLVGAQHALRIVHRRADQERSRLRVVRRIGERDLALVREQRAVDELDLDDELAVLGKLQLALLDLAADALHLVLGDAEVDPHRRQHGDRRQLAVLRIDIGAVGNGREAADAVDRGNDRGVGEVELGRFELRLRLRDCGGGLLVLPLRIVQVFLGQRVLLGKGLGARQIGLGHFHRSLVPLQRGRCGVDLRLERLWVHFEQDLARLDHGAFDVDALVEKAGYARGDVHCLRTLRLRDEHRADRHVARRDGQRRDVDRRPRSVLLFLLAAAADQQRSPTAPTTDNIARTERVRGVTSFIVEP